MAKKKQQRNIKRLLMDLLMLLLLLVGIGVLAYPFVEDSLNDFVDQQLIDHYQAQANQENQTANKKLTAKMQARNKKLVAASSGIGSDPFGASDSHKKANGGHKYYQKHTIAVIDIPKIHVKLPIFDETNDQLLEKGATLVSGTSYPTGGSGTHAVIAAHRGLPEAELFTDLPELKIGNHFYITISGETHAYEIDQKKVVEPTDTSHLKIEAGKDYVTLLTCTPYMINSQRLLVRGHRIPYTPKLKKELGTTEHYKKMKRILLLVGASLLSVALLLLFRKWWLMSQINQRRYLLAVTLVDHQHQPLAAKNFQVYNKRGGKKVTRQQKPLAATTDEQGYLEIREMKGGKYLLADEANHQFIAYIPKIKSQQFSFKAKKAVIIKGDSIEIK